MPRARQALGAEGAATLTLLPSVECSVPFFPSFLSEQEEPWALGPARSPQGTSLPAASA